MSACPKTLIHAHIRYIFNALLPMDLAGLKLLATVGVLSTLISHHVEAMQRRIRAQWSKAWLLWKKCCWGRAPEQMSPIFRASVFGRVAFLQRYSLGEFASFSRDRQYACHSTPTSTPYPILTQKHAGTRAHTQRYAVGSPLPNQNTTNTSFMKVTKGV